MLNSRIIVESLSPSDLRSATRELVRRSSDLEAELLVHIGEIDERKLYLDWAFPSMFAYCVGELGFSEDAACNRTQRGPRGTADAGDPASAALGAGPPRRF